MDDELESADGVSQHVEASAYGEVEEVDGLPVLAEVRPIESVQVPALPTVQAAAVAATGFVAGAATVALMMRRSARRLARAQGGALRGPQGLPISGTRTFLVHVHVLGRPGD
jgi:hypothetical protein